MCDNVVQPLFPHVCARCGASHDKTAWQKLAHSGVVPYVEAGEHAVPERIDMRVCACGSPIFVSLPEGTSVCADSTCGAWIEDGPRIVTPAGVFCSRCGKAAADDCQRFSRSNQP